MVHFVCLICKRVLFSSVSDGGEKEQIIKIVCSICAGEVRGKEIIRPRILNDPVD